MSIDLRNIGDTGTPTGWAGEVNTFADLPSAALNDGKVYLVNSATGSMITFNLKRSGLYQSNGSTWSKISKVQFMFTDDELTFQDDVDNTKQVGFELSEISTSTRRTITVPDEDVDLGDIAGNTGDEVQATETVAGIAEIATQAETDAGTDDDRIVTPEKLANFPFPVGSAVEAPYTFSNNTTDSDPTEGVFKFNNSTQSSATLIYIDGIDSNGVDRSGGILTIPIGTVFLIRGARDPSRFHSVTTTGVVIVATGYFKIPITVDQSGTDLQNNSDCILSSIINQDVSRLNTWCPPSCSPYVVGSGATLTLTSDAEGYKFGWNNSMNDKVFHNIALFDAVSQLEYDASDVEMTIYYYTPTTSTLDVSMALNYNILGDDDNFETGGVTQIVNVIDLDGNTANELATHTFTTSMSGVASDTMLKMNFERLGSAGADTYTDDFFLVGFILKKG